MNPQDPNQPSQPSYTSNLPPGYSGQPDQPAQPPIENPLSVMQPGEQIICEIKRHPVGLIGVYGMSGLIVVGLAVAVFGFAPDVITTVSRSQVLEVGSLLFFIVTLLVFGFVFIANKVYWGNRWVVTSDSITQISQSSLFDKQTSQLSLGNLEDVTVEQDGPLQHMYNFGLLRCETAGERSKFVFLYCPNPNYYAKQILGARERFEQDRSGGDQQRLYREQGAYPQPTPGQYGQYGAPQPPAQPQSAPYPPYQQPQPPTNPMPPSYGGNDPTGGVNVNTE
jgi:hypothetical protein